MKLQQGTIYETIIEDCDFPIGSRVEFLGGVDDDVFSDGNLFDWLGAKEVKRSPDQTPLEYTEEAQVNHSRALSGLEII